MSVQWNGWRLFGAWLIRVTLCIYIVLAVVASAVSANASEAFLTQAAGSQPLSGEAADLLANEADWVVECNGAKRSCEIATKSLPIKQETPLGRISLIGLVDAASKVPVFYLRVPLGLLLAKGADLGIDGGRVGTLAYRSCHAEGCLIPFRLDAQMRARFQRGSQTTVIVYDLSAESMTATFSLIGFTAALGRAEEFVQRTNQ